MIPTAHAEQAHALEELATSARSDYDGGPGMGGPARSARARRPDARSRSRTSRCCRTGRPPTRSVADDTARVNLLNWDGKGTPDGLFPQRGDGRGADLDEAPAADRPAPDTQPTGAPGSRLAAARLPRRAGCSAAGRCSARRRAAARAVSGPLRAFLDHAAPRRWPSSQRDYVETFDSPAQQPVPHLLRPRRHPQARHGAGALQAGLPRGRSTSDDRRRAARPPLRRPGSSPPRSTASAGALLLDHRAGLEVLRLRWRRRVALGRRARGGVARRCRCCAATSARRCAGSPPRGRPRRRSASSRTPPTPRRRPDPHPDRRHPRGAR